MDNDANAGALGEWRFGAGVNCKNLLYITVSTGIGGGWILNGRPYRGANGLAGEIGHMIVDSSGPKYACGRRGCLEAMACGPAIARRAVDRLEHEHRKGEILRQLCDNDFEAVTAEMVSQAANRGDRLAEQILLDAAYSLGTSIGNILSILNVERVVLGGGVTKAGALYWAEVRRAAHAYAFPGVQVDIVPAKLGDDAPLWGAIALTRKR